jgi:hypothetical protein
MKINWNERLLINNDPQEIQKWFEAYKYGSAQAAIDFINRFCWTFDPRLTENREMPFELFDKQEDYIEWLWDRYIGREDGVIDKCRGVGYSWLNAAFSVYLLLFQNSVTVSMYTYKADECHKLGDMNTLLEKMIFIIFYLPELFKKGVESRHMLIKNTINGSVIVGQAGDNAGRGGRSSIFFLDECAFYPKAESIEASVSRNSDCKIWGSTHNGTNTLFYRKCTSGINSVFTFDWWEIPLYNQEWYDKEKAKAEAEGTIHVFKQEVERDASASIDSVVCPSDWVNAAQRFKGINYGKKIGALDPSNEGSDTHGFVAIDGNTVVKAEESSEGDVGDATDKYFWLAVDLGCEEFRYDPIGIGAGVQVRIKEILHKLVSDSKMSPERKQKANNIRVIPWSASGEVLRPKAKDYENKTNSELFENAKAQAWWKIRGEFRNTYRCNNEKDYDATQTVNIPTDGDSKIDKLVRELSQPQYKLSSSGRLMIDKKPKGSRSPNLADAYVIARAEIRIINTRKVVVVDMPIVSHW